MKIVFSYQGNSVKPKSGTDTLFLQHRRNILVGKRYPLFWLRAIVFANVLELEPCNFSGCSMSWSQKQRMLELESDYMLAVSNDSICLA